MQKQKKEVKSKAPKLNVMAELERIATDFYEWPKRVWRALVDRFGNLAKLNHDLGFKLLQRGKFKDAIFRFKLALRFDPNYQSAWYNLGCAHLTMGQMKEAAYAFRRSLKLKPSDENALFMLALSDPASIPADKMPKQMPLPLIASQFNVLAPGYDQLQIEEMQYSGHVEMVKAIRTHTEADKVDYNILELGCGTGLCGSMLRKIAGRLWGVDVAHNMLTLAGQLRDENGRTIYDSLFNQDLHLYLEEMTDDNFEIVCAANVFNYTGDLSRVFPLVQRAIKPGGLFVFNTEVKADSGFSFMPNLGRFAHSKSYLKELAEKAGFSVLEIKDAPMYPGYPSLLCVLRKPA